MVYHYSSWLYGSYDSSTFLGRIGIYGVSIFYILSGLTLYHVYEKKLCLRKIGNYFLRRVLRIHPLLIFATLATIIFVRNWEPYAAIGRPFWSLVLNLTGLFGVVDPARYIAVGAWSIGNELAFYLLFPILIFFNRFNKWLLYVVFVASVFIGGYYAYLAIDPIEGLSSNWKLYIHPLNQLFLFIGGMVIAKLYASVQFKKRIVLALLVATVILFVTYPVSGDRVNLVSGTNRIVFSFFSILMVCCVYKMDCLCMKPIQFLLDKFGEMSYTIYLIHPIVFYSLNKKGVEINLSNELNFLICTLLTFVFSLIVYQLIEKPFIRAYRQKQSG